MAKGGERKERRREETDVSRHHWKSHKPLDQTFRRGPSFRTLAAHAPSPSAFSTHPCGSQGPGPLQPRRLTGALLGTFQKLLRGFPSVIMPLSPWAASGHILPLKTATVISLITSPFLTHRWARGDLCWSSRQSYGDAGQGGGRGGVCSAVCTLETSLMNACELGPLTHVTSRTPHLSLHGSQREHPRRKIQVLTPKLRGPLPGVHPGLSPRGVSKWW